MRQQAGRLARLQQQQSYHKTKKRSLKNFKIFILFVGYHKAQSNTGKFEGQALTDDNEAVAPEPKAPL